MAADDAQGLGFLAAMMGARVFKSPDGVAKLIDALDTTSLLNHPRFPGSDEEVKLLTLIIASIIPYTSVHHHTSWHT